MAESKKNIVGFKKFTDLKSKVPVEDPSLGILPDTDSTRPMNPNLSKDTVRGERFASRQDLIPRDNNVEVNPELDDFSGDITLSGDKTHESTVDFSGRVARFPKNIKASKAFNFLENVKVSKKSIWYLMIEKQDNELQLVKYNHKEGVDLNKFINELKSYYLNKNKSNKKICEAIDKITVDGNDKYSTIKGIPNIETDGKKIITKITEDLIRLLSK